MKIRKIVTTALCSIMAINLVACGAKNNDNSESTENSASLEQVESKGGKEVDKEKKEVVVFAAASLTDVLEELKGVFEKDHEKVNLTFNFDSSGTLKSQILEGADCDLFVSAAQKQMNELDPENENYNGKVAIDNETRLDLLENKVCLVASGENEKGIEKFEDLDSDKVETIALGNEDVPVGQYSEEILENLGIFDKIQSKISYGSNVREVASWVSEKTVDAGIIYATDAKAFDLNIISKADDSMLDNKVIYPAALLKDAINKEEAKDFLEFLKTDQASEIFEKAGFTPVK